MYLINSELKVFTDLIVITVNVILLCMRKDASLGVRR